MMSALLSFHLISGRRLGHFRVKRGAELSADHHLVFEVVGRLRSLVPVVVAIPEPGGGHGSKGCRQAEEGVLSGPCWPVGLLTQLTGTGRPSKPQPGTVLEAKTRVWEEFGEAMEDYRSASKRFWQTVRRLRRGKQYSAKHCLQCGWGAVDLNWGHCRTVEGILRGSPQSHRLAFQ
ncbi:hypothetical protein L3Q82_002346 [Scortum barcoo]|uniref:Uncharacterized protein n=1 Tax=Scortum barcoo TaxID=214431 RepID=A0ACB8VZ12_9TELE|nr:hypothetical protein L3Q82_002346 [Scortum barcoo]